MTTDKTKWADTLIHLFALASRLEGEGQYNLAKLVRGAWAETLQKFMPNYWFDALEPPAALECLRKTPLVVENLIEGLSDEAMNQTPPDGGWAIRNALSHLRDAQGVFDFRVDLFLKEAHPILEAKAVFAWAKNETERPPSAREIFDTYHVSRAETLRKLESLPLSDWWRTGEHEEFGTVTLRQQVSYFAAHESTHLSQIDLLRRQVVDGNLP